MLIHQEVRVLANAHVLMAGKPAESAPRLGADGAIDTLETNLVGGLCVQTYQPRNRMEMPASRAHL